jgi:hypothetical protein
MKLWTFFVLSVLAAIAGCGAAASILPALIAAAVALVYGCAGARARAPSEVRHPGEPPAEGATSSVALVAPPAPSSEPARPPPPPLTSAPNTPAPVTTLLGEIPDRDIRCSAMRSSPPWCRDQNRDIANTPKARVQIRPRRESP